MNGDRAVIISSSRPPLAESVLGLLGSRTLVHGLVLREIRVRYKQTILGVMWAIAHPLVLMVVFTLVFSRVLRLDISREPYPLFVYTGLVPWTFLSTGTALAMRSLVENVPLVTRVSIRRATLPIASLIATFFDMAVALVLLVALMSYFDRPLTLKAFWLLPVMVGQLALGCGLALFVSALNVRFRDLRFVLPLVLQVWFYASPVIYGSAQIRAGWRELYMLNPMAGIIQCYRGALLPSEPFEPARLWSAGAISLCVLVGGMIYFHHVEATLADRI